LNFPLLDSGLLTKCLKAGCPSDGKGTWKTAAMFFLQLLTSIKNSFVGLVASHDIRDRVRNFFFPHGSQPKLTGRLSSGQWTRSIQGSFVPSFLQSIREFIVVLTELRVVFGGKYCLETWRKLVYSLLFPTSHRNVNLSSACLIMYLFFFSL
jgi:hypothetical protein